MSRKHKPRRRPARRTAAPRRETAAPLLAEFEAWCDERGLGVDGGGRIVAAALDLKRERLGSVDPARWAPEQLTAVLTDLLPGHLDLDAREQRHVVPAMALYLGFLGETGRWPASAVPLDDLTGLLAGLAEEVPGAYDRRSTDGPAPTGAAPAHPRVRRDAEPPGPVEENPFAQLWPATLGPVPDLDALGAHSVPTADAAGWLRASPLWRRARALLAGADGADARTAAAQQDADLDLLRSAMVRTGFLTASGEPGPRTLAEAPDADTVHDGLTLHAGLLHELLRAGDRGALAPALTLGALVRAAGPDGFRVPGAPGEAPGDGAPGEGPPAGAPGDGAPGDLVADLALLARAGLLDRRGDAYVLPPALTPVVPYALGMLEPA